jgi:hypothetical protein
MNIPKAVQGVRVQQRRDIPAILTFTLRPEPHLIVNPGFARLLDQGQFDAVLAYTLGELATTVERERRPMTARIVADAEKYGWEVVAAEPR